MQDIHEEERGLQGRLGEDVVPDIAPELSGGIVGTQDRATGLEESDCDALERWVAANASGYHLFIEHTASGWHCRIQRSIGSLSAFATGTDLSDTLNRLADAHEHAKNRDA